MAVISVTSVNVRPLNGAVIRRFNAGGTGKVGDLVYLASDGDVEVADANALATSQAIGVVVGVNGQPGATTFVANDRLDVVVWGPVAWGTGMTPGARVYTSTTAGAGDQTAPADSGDYPFIVGYAEAPGILFVNPQTAIPTANV